MPKTSTAEVKEYVCPDCKKELCHDHKGRGFVRHKSNPSCLFERGEKDKPQLAMPDRAGGQTWQGATPDPTGT